MIKGRRRTKGRIVGRFLTKGGVGENRVEDGGLPEVPEGLSKGPEGLPKGPESPPEGPEVLKEGKIVCA